MDNNYNDNEKNLYYVVCTRAQHKLNIYNEPTKILKKRKKLISDFVVVNIRYDTIISIDCYENDIYI